MEKVCEVCGIVFSGSPSVMVKRKYCSHACNARKNFGMPRVGGDIHKTIIDTTNRLEVAKKVLGEVKPEESVIDPFLAKIRFTIKKQGKCIAYDECDTPIGEYDWDGNIKEY